MYIYTRRCSPSISRVSLHEPGHLTVTQPPGKGLHYTHAFLKKLCEESSPVLDKPLCVIISASFSQSKCPDVWKTSKTSLIPKPSIAQSLVNYDPLPSSPIPRLLFEGFVCNWAPTDTVSSIDFQLFGSMKTSFAIHYFVSFL